jgi:predicted nucleotidyltransferase
LRKACEPLWAKYLHPFGCPIESCPRVGDLEVLGPFLEASVTKPYLSISLQIPILGIIIPKMGIRKSTSATHSASSRKAPAPARAKGVRAAGKPSATTAPSGVADALFTITQQRVLGLLFGQPDRSFFATEVIALAGGGSGATQRELARLEVTGLVTTSRVGNQKHYQANATSPIYAELASIIAKTVGIAEPLRAALAPLAKKILTAFVYGSLAKSSDTARSDIDIMILSEKLSYADVYAALEKAEAQLGRAVSPTVQSPAEWKKKLSGKNAFTLKLHAQPKLFLIGDEVSLE